MGQKKYNIAKRAREWAKTTPVLWGAVRGDDRCSHEDIRVKVGRAVEKLMREAYQEGVEAEFVRQAMTCHHPKGEDKQKGELK